MTLPPPKGNIYAEGESSDSKRLNSLACCTIKLSALSREAASFTSIQGSLCS